MTDLNKLKEKVEDLDKFHQIEILRILNNNKSCIFNENNNGVFVNLTTLEPKVIEQIEKYLDYVNTQETELTEIEIQKNLLSNTFFKDNKDNKDNIIDNLYFK